MSDDRDDPRVAAAATRLQSLARGWSIRRRHGRPDTRTEPHHHDAPFVVTSDADVETFLSLAHVQRGDTVLDIGCGDGRVLIAAWRLCGAKGIGIDIDRTLLGRAAERAQQAGVPLDHIQWHCLDMRSSELQQHIQASTVLFLFLLPTNLAALQENLAMWARPGTRIVTSMFQLHGWTPIATYASHIRSRRPDPHESSENDKTIVHDDDDSHRSGGTSTTSTSATAAVTQLYCYRIPDSIG